jgi:hypothetical protein
LLFDKESLFYSIFQSSHTAGKILIDYPFFIQFSLEVDFVAECLKGLPRRLNSADVDEVEDVPRYFLESSLSNAWAQLVMIPETVQDT